MTDLIAEQSAIKARRKLTRDQSGQFIRPAQALEIKVAAERMKACLMRDAKALEHARGVVYERGHFHALPNPDRLACVAVPAPVLPLFELEAA